MICETNIKSKNAVEENVEFLWFEQFVLQGQRILNIVKKAALSAVPSVEEAASITLDIIRKTETVKCITAELRELSKDAAAFIAAIYLSYIKSNDPGWPGPKDQMVLEELVKLLSCIESFIDAQSEFNTPIQILQGSKQTLEYHERLASLVLDHLQCIESYKMRYNASKILEEPRRVTSFEDHPESISTSIDYAAKEASPSTTVRGSPFCARCGLATDIEETKDDDKHYRRRAPHWPKEPSSRAWGPVGDNLPLGLGMHGFNNGFIPPNLPHVMPVPPTWPYPTAYPPPWPFYQAGAYPGMYMPPFPFPICNSIPAFNPLQWINFGNRRPDNVDGRSGWDGN